MEEAGIHKTAVARPFNLFEFLRMRFVFAFAYVDEILVARENSEQHKKHLEQVFERLSFHGLIK